MSADLAVWHDEHLVDHRRRLRVSLVVSLTIHGVVLWTFAASPPRPPAPAPAALAVDLVALPRNPVAPPVSRPAVPAPARPAPEPASALPARPAPVPEPAPAPVPAAAPVRGRPEETPGRIREAKPAPAKPAPPAPPRPPRRRPEPSVGDDKAAMAALMAELGGDDVSALLESSALEREAAERRQSAAAPGPGVEVSAEQREWDRRAVSQISRRFVDLARYRGQGLRVQLEVEVLASGGIAREPRLLRSSGDLDFDRRAIAAIQLAVPFPAPPKPGTRRLDLTSEE